MNDQNCFVCGEDLTNKTKVLSYFNFHHPDKLHRRLRMCSKCAKKDLEVAHQNAKNKSDIIRLEIKEEIRGEFYWTWYEKVIKAIFRL